MKRYSFIFLTLIIILSFAESCSTTSRLYRTDDKNQTYAGKLSDSNFAILKQYLTYTTKLQLEDTIIIRYDYNNETCWNILDQREDDYIMGFVKRHQERVQQVLASRQSVSVLEFREPGNSLNKIKKWNKSIIVDSSKQLLNLVFKERCTCGNSIILMPDKRFVFVRSDSHFEALDLTQKQIEEILSKL